MPRLPEEDSTTVETPGTSFPALMACSIIDLAARSLMEPPGLKRSHLAYTWNRAGGNRRSRATSGVPPIVATMSGSRVRVARTARAAPSEARTVIPAPFC